MTANLKNLCIGLTALTGAVVASTEAAKVPQSTFPRTLQAQEEALKTNSLLERFGKSRKELSQDRYRPLYHYVNPEHSLNDPNGLCYWQGRWHMFYQEWGQSSRMGSVLADSHLREWGQRMGSVLADSHLRNFH